MTLNRRELHVLYVLALMLTVGGGVRLAARIWPGKLPGLAHAPLEDSVAVDSVADRNPGAGQPSSLARADSLFPGGKLDLNAATSEELCLLPGIGPAIAQRVVDLRRQRGAFRRVEDLLDVRGIGPKTIAKLRPLVTVH